jgi:hypothetical protein
MLPEPEDVDRQEDPGEVEIDVDAPDLEQPDRAGKGAARLTPWLGLKAAGLLLIHSGLC